MAPHILAVLIFVVMFVLIVMDKIERQYVSLGCGLLMIVLVFGLGMSMILVWNLTAAGIAVAAAGVVPMLLANPVYNAVLKRNKKKYGDEILRLAEECEKIGKGD